MEGKLFILKDKKRHSPTQPIFRTSSLHNLKKVSKAFSVLIVHKSFFQKKISISGWYLEKYCTFATAFGSLAQLVQSAAFTRQRSLVQIQYVPQEKVTMWPFFYCFA